MGLYSRLRENPDTARAGMNWTDEENAELMKRATSNMQIKDIAFLHKRTIGGIKSRIMLNALDMVKDNNMTLEDVSKLVHIPLQMLEKYKKRQDDKKDTNHERIASKKNKTDKQSEDTYMSILIEIRDLLYIIAKANVNQSSSTSPTVPAVAPPALTVIAEPQTISAIPAPPVPHITK